MKNCKQILNRLFKKLSSGNVLLIILLNLLFPFAALPIADAVFRMQYPQAMGLPGEYRKILLLVGMALLLLLLRIDVAFLLSPLLGLEQMIRRFRIHQVLPERNDEREASAVQETFMDIMSEQKEAVEREYKTEMLRQQMELSALQSQINPHFLYNTLDSIRGLALLRGADEIATMTEALSRLFRSMIAREGQLVTLAYELQSVESYMVIQGFRFHNRYRYQVQIQEEELQQCLVPNMILQPLVENAIMHGLEQREEGGIISIDVSATTRRLVIQVEDNGVGMTPPQLTMLYNRLCCDPSTQAENDDLSRGKGIALMNINQRIALEFGEEYGLDIMSTLGIGTVVELSLPLLLQNVSA